MTDPITVVPANEASREDPIITHRGREITWGEVHVGSRNVFVAAGFIEVSHPTLRRVVMRIDF